MGLSPFFLHFNIFLDFFPNFKFWGNCDVLFRRGHSIEDIGEGGVKKQGKIVTSFMDDPYISICTPTPIALINETDDSRS